MPKNSNREIVTLGDVARSQAASASTTVRTPEQVADPDAVSIEITVPRSAVEAAIEDGRLIPVGEASRALYATPGSAFATALARETEAAHASADAKEAKLDAEGYGGGSADPGSIVGLADVTPIADTPKNGDTDGTDPHAG